MLWSTYLLVAEHCGSTKGIYGSSQTQSAYVFPFSQVGCLRFSPHNDTHVKRQCDMVAKRVISATRLLELETWLYSLTAVGYQAGHLASLCLRFLMCKMRVIVTICKNGGGDNKVLRST